MFAPKDVPVTLASIFTWCIVSYSIVGLAGQDAFWGIAIGFFAGMVVACTLVLLIVLVEQITNAIKDAADAARMPRPDYRPTERRYEEY